MDLNTILAEAIIRAQGPSLDIAKVLFKEQLAFVLDPNPFKTAVCTRRAGKTVACAADLLSTCITSKGVTCLYITLSRSNAKRIVWPELKRLNREHNCGGVPNESDLSMHFPDQDSRLYLSGASDRTEIEKFRGLALKKVYLDESQSFPQYIRDLVDDVISPALMDYAGMLCLIGTPGPVPAGFFYDCAQSADWAHHSWTFWDNPFIEIKSGLTHQEVLARELKRRGVTIEDPSIQREWFGKWIMDTDSLVFHYQPDKNHYDELPPGKYHYILGVDFGFEDADALAVLAWSERSPMTYLVDEIVVAKQGLTELSGQIEMLRNTYDISKIVADFGGLGKKLSEEMIRRWQIPLMPAEKAQKDGAIEIFNDALRRGHFRAKKDSRLASDSMLVEWDRDKSTPEKRKISDKFHSDILDAALYAFRESPAFTWVPAPIKPKYGTEEWGKAEVTRMEKEAEEYFKSQEQTESIWGYD